MTHDEQIHLARMTCDQINEFIAGIRLTTQERAIMLRARAVAIDRLNDAQQAKDFHKQMFGARDAV